MRWERLGRKVALDVALGLNYLHSRRTPMMHRDLKSPNVLLSGERGRGRALAAVSLSELNRVT